MACQTGRIFQRRYSPLVQPVVKSTLAHYHAGQCRLVEGVELLAHLLHPKRVPHPEGVPQALKLQLSGSQRCRQRLLPNYFAPFP